jgi:hypothetical protein
MGGRMVTDASSLHLMQELRTGRRGVSVERATVHPAGLCSPRRRISAAGAPLHSRTLIERRTGPMQPHPPTGQAGGSRAHKVLFGLQLARAVDLSRSIST